MKTILIILLSICAAIGQPFSFHDQAFMAKISTPAASGNPTPILWWKLADGSGTTLSDSSGNGHTGTLLGSPIPVWITGTNSNSALSCEINTNNTSTAYAAETDTVSAIGGSQHASLTGWLFCANGTIDYSSFGFQTNTAFTANFQCAWNANEQVTYVIVGNGSLADGTFNTGSASGWHFLAVTYDGTQGTANNRVVAYFDAVAQTLSYTGTFPTTLPTTASLGGMSIAQGAGGDGPGGFYYGGAYQDLRLFAVTLTQAQVTSIYNAGAQ